MAVSGIPFGVAFVVLVEYVTGWPNPPTGDAAVVLAVLIIVSFLFDYVRLRRERTVLLSLIADIRRDLRP